MAAVFPVFVLMDRHLEDKDDELTKLGKKNGPPNQVTWYLLDELKGTSQIFLLRARMAIVSPVANSTHLSSAASEASPFTSRWTRSSNNQRLDRHVKKQLSS